MTIRLCEPDALGLELDEEPGGVLVAHVHGPLDLSTAPTLDQVLQQYLTATIDGSTPHRMVLDLSDVEFLDGRGVTVLVRLARWAEAHDGERPCLVGLTRCGRRVLELVEVINMFSVQDTLDDAVAGGGRRGNGAMAAEGAGDRPAARSIRPDIGRSPEWRLPACWPPRAQPGPPGGRGEDHVRISSSAADQGPSRSARRVHIRRGG